MVSVFVRPAGLREAGARQLRLVVQSIRWITALAVVAGAGMAHAQAWPDKPVRVIVPFAAGGSTDLIARAIAQQVAQSTGQAFVIDNRPTAGGIQGAEAAARAQPDGYTLLLTTSTTHSIAPHLIPKLPYHPVNDFTPIAHLADTPLVLLVSPKLNIKSVPELIALARKQPGELNLASNGTGTIVHLTAEAFKAQAGISLAHVPYKGAAPAMTDLVAGNVQVMFDAIPTALSFVRQGRVQALAVTSPRRLALVPELPTLDELGLTGFSAAGWYGLYAPHGMKPELVQRIYAEFAAALRSPEILDRLARAGAEPGRGSTADFVEMVARDSARWGSIIRERKITLD